MSDDDRDIDIESDDENDSDNGNASQRIANSQNFTQAEKRAHHNALERKRRDQIKESFTSLREAVPSLKGEKASRAQILKKTTEYIQNMRKKLHVNRKDIEGIKKQNSILDAQIRMLESAKSGDVMDPIEYQQLVHIDHPLSHKSDSSDEEEHDFSSRSKKMKTSFQA